MRKRHSEAEVPNSKKKPQQSIVKKVPGNFALKQTIYKPFSLQFSAESSYLHKHHSTTVINKCVSTEARGRSSTMISLENFRHFPRNELAFMKLLKENLKTNHIMNTKLHQHYIHLHAAASFIDRQHPNLPTQTNYTETLHYEIPCAPTSAD